MADDKPDCEIFGLSAPKPIYRSNTNIISSQNSLVLPINGKHPKMKCNRNTSWRSSINLYQKWFKRKCFVHQFLLKMPPLYLMYSRLQNGITTIIIILWNPLLISSAQFTKKRYTRVYSKKRMNTSCGKL